ncbi:phosphoglycerate dehydrogenase [Collinsella intestinalis]|uniref:phosphoglycerate dehydrogenase n=1 Tax=Collinsella intestinalis TaxID=147207 RepID=UPI00195A8835|nr:phosphoglycerate dehydrogenase [Collinsella intestinalis]MBM6683433.1 phosphoglycerate dehydrogenase [Collinsella intestinalis]
MRYIKTIDDITKDGTVEFGAGYGFVDDAAEADAILMRSTDLHGYDLPTSVRAIARCGAGVNNIPIEEYARRGVVVFNSPGANANAVKEMVLCMMILSSRGIVQSMDWVRAHEADTDIMVAAEHAKKAFVGRELKGKRVGVIGLGNVGSKVANACVTLGMDVFGYDPFISVEHAWELSRDVQRVGTLEDLCRGCDYLTLHVPSKADTVHMIGAEQLDLLAPDAVLINFARETIVDEEAVDAALRAGRLAWFATDFATPATVKMPRTFITTHSGAGTEEAEANCADMAISELKDYLENGNIAHSVNYPSCSMGKARAASRVACLHANVPNMIGQITAILAHDNANVQRMVNESAGENAYTMFDTDEHLEQSTIEELRKIPAVYRVRVIK